MYLPQDVFIALDFLYRSLLFESLPEYFDSGDGNSNLLSTI